MWSKLEDSKDLIIYEKRKKKHNIRIEARLKDDAWEIFKTYFDDDVSRYKEHYSASNKGEANVLIQNLLNEKDLSSLEIEKLRALKAQSFGIQARRIFKDEFTEKFSFALDSFTDSNFLVAHYDEEVQIDIVLHERYKPIEDEIVSKIIDFLGLKKGQDQISCRVYYFTSYKHNIFDADPKVMMASVNLSIDS